MKFLFLFLLTGCASIYKAADDLETAAIVVKDGIERAEYEKSIKEQRRSVPIEKRYERPSPPKKRIKKTKACVTVESGWIWKSKREVCQ